MLIYRRRIVNINYGNQDPPGRRVIVMNHHIVARTADFYFVFFSYVNKFMKCNVACRINKAKILDPDSLAAQSRQKFRVIPCCIVSEHEVIYGRSHVHAFK